MRRRMSRIKRMGRIRRMRRRMGRNDEEKDG